LNWNDDVPATTGRRSLRKFAANLIDTSAEFHPASATMV
jgi:hypothetical protein